MTKLLILAATAALAVAGCTDEPVGTDTPIGADAPVLDGPAEVVTEPTDDAVDTGEVVPLPMMDDGILMVDSTMTEGETFTGDR